MAKRVFKTKKVLSGVKTEYRAWKEWSEGDVLVGTLVGTSQNRKNKSKKDWILKVEDCFFEDKKEEKRVKGKTITLNTAGQLDKGMEQIQIGQMVQITYNGSKEMQGGDYEGQNAHTMEVIEVEEDDGSETPSDDTPEGEPEDENTEDGDEGYF